MEQWKQITGTHYLVGDQGNVVNGKTGKPLPIYRNVRTSYRYVQFHINGKLLNRYVAKLVARAFIGDPPAGKPQVDHIDGDKGNNAVANLEYVSQSENVNRAIARGRTQRTGPHLKPDQITTIKDLWLYTDLSQVKIAKRMGITNATVSRVLKREGISRRD